MTKKLFRTLCILYTNILDTEMNTQFEVVSYLNGGNNFIFLFMLLFVFGTMEEKVCATHNIDSSFFFNSWGRNNIFYSTTTMC